MFDFIQLCVSISCCSFRPVMTTVAPILEHSIAVARPMPDDAPVTSIVFPSREKGLYIGTRLYDAIQILDRVGFANVISRNGDIIVFVDHRYQR